MKAVVQRVSSARVAVVADDGSARTVAEIATGAVVLLGVMRGDGEGEALRLAERIAAFRYFSDDAGRMGRSLADVGGSLLVVSQFTLAADGRKGRRPSFDAAAPAHDAAPLVARFIACLDALGVPTAQGVFGARMRVELVNEGPVTFVLEEPPEAAPTAVGTTQVLA